MKTLKRGRISKKHSSAQVWVGYQIECKNCGGRFRLERGDKVKLIGSKEENFGELGLNGVLRWRVRCPTRACEKTIEFTVGVAF